MSARRSATLLALATAFASGAACANVHERAVLFDRPVSAAPDVIDVRSTAFEPDRAIPDRYTSAGAGLSPPLSWSGVPSSAKSLVLLVEDPDAPRATPYVHWLVYDIPAATTSLPDAIPAHPRLDAGALQGETSRGTVGYAPPAPPKGDLPHAYHFELFALDEPTLGLRPGADRAEVVAAMQGHVVGKGELVGVHAAR